MPENASENQAQSKAHKAFIEYFSNQVPGSIDLHVTDGPILMRIIDHFDEIPGVGFLLKYTAHILRVSAGRINRPQWHSRASIMDLMKMSGNNLSRYESKWEADGWIIKHEIKGKGAYRLFGIRFNDLRMKATLPQIGGSTQIQNGSSTPIQIESSTPIQIESPNQTILIKQNESNEKNVVVEERATTTWAKWDRNIVSLARRFEPWYSMGSKNSYDWNGANQAATRIYEKGPEYVERFASHLREHYPRQKFFVGKDMWRDIEAEMNRQSEPKYENIEIYQNSIEEEQWPPGGKSLDDIPF